ncbi:hypothetical protein [Opitutus sp. GAS368]|uniref:hypothetical protein n=1 Tax=Opitutus sp. GAS368 TaxID=1882749 RepID=UPI000B8719AA|nr:hypothetical protein [Opitutus sp. GAS368]
MKKEVRGAAGETKAETATRDAKDVATAAALSTAPFGTPSSQLSQGLHRRREDRLQHRSDEERRDL